MQKFYDGISQISAIMTANVPRLSRALSITSIDLPEIKLRPRAERLPLPPEEIVISSSLKQCKGPRFGKAKAKPRKAHLLRQIAENEAEQRWDNGLKENTVQMSKEIHQFLCERCDASPKLGSWIPEPETIEDWIRHLNPAPKRGRPKK